MAYLIMSQRLYDKVFEKTDVKVTSKDVTSRAQMWLKCAEATCHGENVEFVYAEAPEWGNYFDVRKGEVSYKAGVQLLNEEGKWIREGRQVCKASKLVNFLIGTIGYRITGDYVWDDEPKLKARFLELVAINAGAKDLEVNVSDDPECIYAMPTAYKGSGTLDTSCMRAESQYNCHNQRGFYNAMGASIAYSINAEGKLVARALLWDNVYNLEDQSIFKYMDRIYGSGESEANFKEWAHENGYAYKVEQSYSNSCLILPDKRRVYDYMVVSNPVWNGGFPYMDSLIYLHVAGDNLCISTSDNDLSPYYLLQHTNGMDVRPQIRHCPVCGVRFELIADNYTTINGQDYCLNCAHESDYYNCGILNTQAVWSDFHYTWIYNDDRSMMVEGSWAVTNSGSFRYVNGIPYFNNSTAIRQCDYCREWHLANEVNYYPQISRYSCAGCLADAMARRGYHLFNGEWTNKTECEICHKLYPPYNTHYYSQLGKKVCVDCIDDAMKNEGFVFDHNRWSWFKGIKCECCEQVLLPEKVKYYRLLGESVCAVCFKLEMLRAGYVFQNSHWRRNAIHEEQQQLSFAS